MHLPWLLSSLLSFLTIIAAPFPNPNNAEASNSDQTVLGGNGTPLISRQNCHFVWGIADAFAEYVTVKAKDGTLLAGTLFWPNPNRAGYYEDEDFGNVADYKFLPDRPFHSMIQLTWIPITQDSGRGNGKLLALPRGSVTLDNFVPLTPEEMGSYTFRHSCKNEEFWGNITFWEESDCPSSLPEGSGCMELVTAPVRVKGNLREAMSRVYYGWEKDPNFVVEWDSDALQVEPEKVQVHLIDSAFHLQEGYDVELGDDGEWEIVGDKMMVAVESIGAHKDVIPGTATRPWSGWFWRLIPVDEDK